MDLAAAINAVNERHHYVPDRGDEWNVDPTGDCEDYSFAVIWRYADESRWGFVKAILFGPFKFWFVKVGPDEVNGKPSNNGHFVTEHTDTGLCFDNSWRRLVVRRLMEQQTRYRFISTYGKLRVLWKLATT